MILPLITTRNMMHSITAMPLIEVSHLMRFTKKYSILRGQSFRSRTMYYSNSKTVDIDALPISPLRTLGFLFITYTNQRRNLPQNAVVKLNRGKI